MARSFNGTTDFIEASVAAVTSYPITFAGWGYPTSTATNGDVLGITQAATIQGFVHLSFTSTGPTAAFAIKNFSGTVVSVVGTTTITTNTWFHFAGSVDASNINVYTNGADKQSASNGGLALDFSPDNTSIGVLIRPANINFWPGRLADCAAWNVALTDAEIRALAKGARPNTIRPTALKGYWPCDGLVSPEPDISGFKHNGTLTGTGLAAGPPTMMLTPRPPSFLDKVPITAVFRKSLSSISRVGARQRVAW